MAVSPSLRAAIADQHLLVAVSLPPDVGAAARARGVVRDVLHRTEHDDLAEVACLLTSELVANAVVHASAPVELVVDLDDVRLAIEVIDGSDDQPRPEVARPLDEHGRGLAMVASLADEWGIAPSCGGKSVWFRLTAR